MDKIERILDEQKLWVQQSLKNISEDPENEKHAYISHEDLCKCYQGETLLAIQAPSGTQLEVPPPELVRQLKQNVHCAVKISLIFSFESR